MVTINIGKFQRDKAIEFAQWLKNNWFIPTHNGDFWKLDKGHEEYSPTLETDKTIFTEEELYDFFNEGLGQI